MSKKHFLTKEKKVDLEEELDHLKNTRRAEIAKDLERAKSMGDLSENAEYHEARAEQANLEDRIREIEEILKNSEVVNHTKSDVAEIGSTVTLRKKYASTELQYSLMGEEEADMSAGKISYTSPLGQALMGRKEGESFTFETPSGEQTYHVVKIS